MMDPEGSYISEVESLTLNPLDLFVSSIDTLHHGQIDHVIPPNEGWATRPDRRSGVVATGGEREAVREMCRRGIPPCLRW